MNVEETGNRTIITPDISQLDSLNSQEFSSTYAPLISSYSNIALDISKIGYIDSSGLGAILEIVRETHDRDAKICVFGAQPSVKVLFRMVQLEKLVPIFETKDQAVAWLAD
ncbi:MAG: STAS domain-containing protein [Spirochaetaceae bacterium]|nr:STAS domain-containing protein [Spirochaetaceae bacterium]